MPLVPVAVAVWAGQSQIGGSRSVKADITGYEGLATDANCFIWDVPTQAIVTLVPGSAELQPSLALMDPAYTDTVGPLGEFDRFFRRDNPSTPLYHFKYAIGGSRFTSAGSLGADANWAAGVSGGAREKMLAQWNNFVTALAAAGKTPVVTWMATDLGYSSGIDSTEATNYQADMTALIAWWRTNMIGSTARLTIARACGTISGFAFISTIRTAQVNIQAAAPTLIDLLDTDGFELIADNVHFSAASHMRHGELLYCHYANRWHPMQDRLNGSAIFPTDFYRGADLRNTYIGATKTGKISVLWDMVRGRTGPITFTQTTDLNRPSLATETIGGLAVRTARFTGSPMRMTRSTGRMAGTTPFGLCIAARIATPTGPSCLIGEGLSTNGNGFIQFRTDVDGLFESLSRDSTGVIVTGPTDWSAAAAAGDVMRTYIVGCDAAGNVTPQSDGTIGAVQATEIDTMGTSNRVSIGVFSANATLYYADADYGEFWWTNIEPDSAYRTKVRTYMQWRWGTP